VFFRQYARVECRSEPLQNCGLAVAAHPQLVYPNLSPNNKCATHIIHPAVTPDQISMRACSCLYQLQARVLLYLCVLYLGRLKSKASDQGKSSSLFKASPPSQSAKTMRIVRLVFHTWLIYQQKTSPPNPWDPLQHMMSSVADKNF
jgi:hypothetical protein